MNYLSLFSGIEAASVAWRDFGWTCVGVSEIDPFPCAVLKERFPTVPNLGDITQITKERLDELKQKHGAIDIVVGGSPCQSFSVAGKRLGLEDARGNLMFQYCRVVRTVLPKFFIWENVPGALSSGKGKDFGALITEMADIGYSLCWRVLDAQFFGVPQRRKRVFLVGCLGKNTSGFEILFEREGSQRNLDSGRKEGEDDTSQVKDGIREHDQEQVTMLQNNQNHAGIIENATVSYTLTAAMGMGGGHVPMIVEPQYYEHHPNDSRVKGPKEIGNSVTARYGTGGGNVPLVLETRHENSVFLTSKIRTGGDLEFKVCPTLTAQTKSGDTMPLTIEHKSYNISFNDANGTRKDRPNGGCYINEVNTSNAITCAGVGDTKVVEITAPVSKGNGECWENYETFTSLTSGGGQMGQGYPAVRIESKVRRLTPLECERLQGFPDNWTRIAYKKKTAQDCPISPRYKALGNSMAVPVMRFIGLGILEVERNG